MHVSCTTLFSACTLLHYLQLPYSYIYYCITLFWFHVNSLGLALQCSSLWLLLALVNVGTAASFVGKIFVVNENHEYFATRTLPAILFVHGLEVHVHVLVMYLAFKCCFSCSQTLSPHCMKLIAVTGRQWLSCERGGESSTAL